MAKTSKSSFSFSGRVSKANTIERDKFSNFGYLNLPTGVKALKIEEKKYLLDFLPYIVSDETHPERNEDEQLARKGDIWWRRPFRTHKGVGPDEETVVCPKSFGKPCPICEYVKQLQEKGADQDEIYALKSKGRFLYIVIPIGNKKLDETIMVWDYSYTLFEKQLREELENDPSYDRFPGLTDGLTLEIRFREEKFGKGSYFETSRINFHERDSEYEETILQDVPNLDECLKVLNYKQLEQLFFDTGDITDTEDTEEDNDTVTKTTSYRKPKTVNQDKKGIEEEDEEFEEEDEVPEKKSPRKRGTSSKPVDGDCPSGYQFGKDTDRFDECEDCEVWETCNETRKKRK